MLRIGVIIVAVLLSGSVGAEQYRTQVFSVNNSNWELRLPTGYQLELLAEMTKPRMLTFTNDNALLVGSLTENVYRLPPPYTKVTVFAKLWGSNNHGVAVRNNEVWVAQPDGIYRAPYRPQTRTYTFKDFKRIAKLAAKTGGHSSRTIKVGPDNKIYVSIGISGNCSDEYIGAPYPFEYQRGGILRLREPSQTENIPNRKNSSDADTPWETYASGLRNPMGFNWHPSTEVLYASNHGPDHLGYDQPAEYFSRILPGSFHGMPWFWFDGNKMVRDKCINSKPPRTDITLPLTTFPARNAPMDVAFVPQGAFTKAWTHHAVASLHGSWATQPKGGFFGSSATRRPPWIALVLFEGDEITGMQPLIEGFQNNDGDRLARPMGLAFGRDKALYFTSDGGAIQGLFRLTKINAAN